MLADYHMHTSFSDDSVYPMKDCINRAISLGFDEICFTEHIDYGCVNAYCCDCQTYLDTVRKYQKEYSDKITIKYGIEFGAQARHKKYFKEIFDKYPFDFVLLSFHQVDDKELWNQDFQTGKTQEEYNRIYFEEMLKTAQAFDFYSVLAHIDLMRRYDPNGEYPFEKSREIIEEILKHVIASGKGIEVNTSSFRYKLNDLCPATPIIKLYKELGGEIITIGSDSHRETQVGDHVREVREILKSMGYKYFTTFDKMVPKFHEL
jgi:histidinol-phosphatase (PHP family)